MPNSAGLGTDGEWRRGTARSGPSRILVPVAIAETIARRAGATLGGNSDVGKPYADTGEGAK
ncbi:hypothetical protein ACOZ4L_03805 [Haloplanus ruber]|uniref:Uncharacterized protein n=1 Tax=Haloplanus ruber TaxID=869892 RepID=A0ABD6D1Q4_9EURY|nr:hypothetical protein [Haloplanus ruber]